MARVISVLVVLVAAVVAGMPESQVLFGSFDKVHFDFVTRFFARPGTGKVAVINIDAKTIRALGTEAIFQRTVHARLIDRLNQASSVTFDMLFPGAGEDDFDFADAVHRNGRVVLPVPSGEAGPSGKPLLRSSPAICSGVAGVGHHEVAIGHYGTVTGIVPYVQIGPKRFPHVALEAIRVAGLHVPGGKLQSYVCEQALSVDTELTASLLLMLPGLQGVAQYSYIDVLNGQVPPQTFRNKLVFVGHSVYEAGGEFQISSLNMQSLSRAQLDALLADSLLDGNLVREVPRWLQQAAYAVLALIMLAICIFAPGRKMHWFALLWGAGVLSAATALLGGWHIWLPVGAIIATGTLIYATFAWARLTSTYRLLRREIGELREISSAVGFDPNAPASTPQPVADSREEISQAMRQIRSWQEAYVNVINLLPYPIFLEQNGRIVLWNDKASQVLGKDFSLKHAGDDPHEPAAVTIPAIQQLLVNHRAEAAEGGIEMELNGMAHLLLCVPFTPLENEKSESNLICLVDIAGVKETVTHDRQVLRHMAHDLRNPLTTILALLEAQNAKAGPDAPPQDEKFVGELRRLVDYSLNVAQDFMQLSRAEHLDTADFAPVPLFDLVDETVDNISASAEQKSIELQGPDLDGNDVFVLANRDMLMRSLINIIDNAIKYSSPDTTITVSIQRDIADLPGHVAIDIADQGEGIPAEAMPHLFEPFFQVGVDHQARSGVGLGLPFVKTVIERHGGTVSVTSEVGKGSVFHITLPVTMVELG
ncbi:ATP-binding protein [Andreprevotia chitinilytica]|uniref:ATP-binding protein n=1 Tax=Andreprevotia chitinilytica TaxID=396808 RepID=UPI0006924700|nr:ATP-binding protein [Andreprevotia chitinilytica]